MCVRFIKQLVKSTTGDYMKYKLIIFMKLYCDWQTNKSRRLSPGQEKNQKFEMLGERWLKSGMGKINKREWQKKKKKNSWQLCLESINTQYRHAIVRGKKWDKIILCAICVGPTGHISDKTSMTQHVETDIGLDRHGESTGRINRSG